MGVRSPHTQGGDLCLGKPHLGAPRRSAGSAGLEWSQRDLPPNLHTPHASREVVGPQTPTCTAAQGRPGLSNGAIGQPPQTAPGERLLPQSALGWSHSVREPMVGGCGGTPWVRNPHAARPPGALLPTCTPSRADTICYSQGTWPQSSGQCQRPLRLLGWKNWGAESWIITPSELRQALGHPGGPPLLLPPGQGSWAPGNFPGEAEG